ncbi:MAG: hypothetical protein ACE5JS_13255 [Nitrospinota bacterium]
MKWANIKPGLWGAVGGAIVLAIVGFAWGGWVTGSAAQEMVKEAVVDRLAPICVEQFNQDPEKVQKLKELKKEDAWKRRDYVEKQGWATMPGEGKPDSKVAEKCVDMLPIT